MMGICVGTISGYDAVTATAEVNLTSTMRHGDRLHIVGPETDIEHPAAEFCENGMKRKFRSRGRVKIASVGAVQEGDLVFRLLG